MYQLFGCVGLIQIDRLTFSKIKFESDPFSRVSSRCVIGVSLISCCWLDSNSMFMKIGVRNVVFFWYRRYSFLFNSS